MNSDENTSAPQTGPAATPQLPFGSSAADPPHPTRDQFLDIAAKQQRTVEIETLSEKRLVPGLVSKSYGSLGTCWTADGPVNFAAAGRLRLAEKHAQAGLPAVGDWVALRHPQDNDRSVWLVQEILPRRTAFWRKNAGTAQRGQIIAANMDLIFIVTSLNRDYNPRRIERYLSLTRESGAQPVIVLSKSDMAGDELDGYIEETRDIDPTAAVHAVSCMTGEGLSTLDQYLQPARMMALLGSSGVGKSTLINHWLGMEYLRVGDIRNDERGRHTTTHREMIRLPSGAIVIDTPGMREVQLMDHSAGLQEAFDDITRLAEDCRFTDCSHDTEPGCAVKAAIEQGILDEDRLAHYVQLKQEIGEAEKKQLQQKRRSRPRPRK